VTRVNLILVEELNDRMLLAEHREIKRIPNAILNGKARLDLPIPSRYTMGKGHVRFFYNKLFWLLDRYELVHKECIKRGFNVQDYSSSFSVAIIITTSQQTMYIPTNQDIEISRQRINERMKEAKK
jgi:deoxyribonuclease (pyrimidine dimer)